MSEQRTVQPRVEARWEKVGGADEVVAWEVWQGDEWLDTFDNEGAAIDYRATVTKGTEQPDEQKWLTDHEIPPMGSPLQLLGARLAELLDEDKWNNIEPMLFAVARQLAKDATPAGQLPEPDASQDGFAGGALGSDPQEPASRHGWKSGYVTERERRIQAETALAIEVDEVAQPAAPLEKTQIGWGVYHANGDLYEEFFLAHKQDAHDLCMTSQGEYVAPLYASPPRPSVQPEPRGLLGQKPALPIHPSQSFSPEVLRWHSLATVCAACDGRECSLRALALARLVDASEVVQAVPEGRQPLSVEQIDIALKPFYWQGSHPMSAFIGFARAIELAHGITSKVTHE